MANKIKTPIIERFSDGQVIITEGVVSTKAYIIQKGKVRISKKIDSKSVTVVTLAEGDIFGEMGLFQETVRYATAIAMGEVEVGVIDKKRFDELMHHAPDELKVIMNAVIDRLRITTDKLTILGLQWEKTRKAMEAISTKEKQL
ncbi:MAG: cyclic nucleotide-binding domain-containing protein [Nitrospinae bacterium]|nr:cyclic nucleotide-binding domain-containing protein [Nitrospinota bacterium]